MQDATTVTIIDQNITTPGGRGDKYPTPCRSDKQLRRIVIHRGYLDNIDLVIPSIPDEVSTVLLRLLSHPVRKEAGAESLEIKVRPVQVNNLVSTRVDH